jgi:hypothetical protein
LQEKSTIFENNVFSEFDAIAVVAVVLGDSIVSTSQSWQ